MGGIGPADIKAYNSLETSAAPTTTFNPGMLRATTRIVNFPIFIPVILMDINLNSSYVISFSLYLLWSSITDKAIDNNDKVGIKTHKDELLPPETSWSTNSSTLIVSSSLLSPYDSTPNSFAISLDTRISPSGYFSIHSST